MVTKIYSFNMFGEFGKQMVLDRWEHIIMLELYNHTNHQVAAHNIWETCWPAYIALPLLPHLSHLFSGTALHRISLSQLLEQVVGSQLLEKQIFSLFFIIMSLIRYAINISENNVMTSESSKNTVKPVSYIIIIQEFSVNVVFYLPTSRAWTEGCFRIFLEIVLVPLDWG